MKAIYKGTLYDLGDNLNVVELTDRETGVNITIPYSDPDLIIDPTDSEINKTNKGQARPETRTEQKWSARFDAGQKARRISGMTTFDADDLKIPEAAQQPQPRKENAASHAPTDKEKQRIKLDSEGMNYYKDHADKLADALRVIQDSLQGLHAHKGLQQLAIEALAEYQNAKGGSES